MNTLTSLAEWIEESPKVAQELIEALAEEFRLLIAIVDKTTIPLDEELRLCQLHAKVMSLRQDKTITLLINNELAEFAIPPGVVHTLIENAISHTQTLNEQSLQISIDITQQDEQVMITVTSPLAEHKNQKLIGLGTGKRYIEARLAHVYQQNFSLNEGPEAKQWHSKITIGEAM